MNEPHPTRGHAPCRRRRLKIPITATVGIVGASLLLTMTPANAFSKTTESYTVGTAQKTFTNTTTTFKWEGAYEFDPQGNYVYACDYSNTTRMAIDGNGSATPAIRRALDDLAMKYANTYLKSRVTDADDDLGGKVSFRTRYEVYYPAQVTCPDPTYAVKANGGTTGQRQAAGVGGGVGAALGAATAIYFAGGLYDQIYGTQITGSNAFEAAAGCLVGLVGLQATQDVLNADKLPWYDWLLKCGAGSVGWVGFGKIGKVFSDATLRDEFFNSVALATEYIYQDFKAAKNAAAAWGVNMWEAMARIYREYRNGDLPR